MIASNARVTRASRAWLVRVSVNFVLKITCDYIAKASLDSLQVAFCCWIMPRCLSAYAHKRIIRMWQQGKTPAAIVRELAQDGISTTLWTVKRRIFAWTKGDGLEDRRRLGRPSSITKEIAEYMDRMLEDDDELTASEFHRLIVRKFDARIPAPTIRRFLRMKLQWIIVRARTGPMISETNKKRLDFATQCISDKDSFDDVIWTDESSIQLVRHTRLSSLHSFSSASSSSAPTTPEDPLPPPGIAVSWCRPLPLLRQWCPWHRRECVLH